jgi:AcrR family transcriptional regulator
VNRIAKRAPTGAALLQADVTEAITEAVLDELAESGYGRLSMEAVAKRAGVGKSALYRRWSSKQDMVISVIASFSVGLAPTPDTGSLRGDVLAALQALLDWLTHERFSRIFPDLIAESGRNPALASAMFESVGEPRRRIGAGMLHRAVARGELPADVDMEMALDAIGALIYWRLVVRRAELGPGYLDSATDLILRALGATSSPSRRGDPPATTPRTRTGTSSPGS